MKRVIDRNVTFGKAKTSLSNDADRMLKKFRSDLNEAVRDISPEYKEANAVYSETIETLNGFQAVAGKKLDLSSKSAHKAAGTKLRILLGNRETRGMFMDAIDEVERVALKYQGSGKEVVEAGRKTAKRLPIDDDLITQVMMVDEMNAVFGAAGRGSFGGEIEKSVTTAGRMATQSSLQTGIDLAGKGLEKARGINEAGAIKALERILTE